MGKSIFLTHDWFTILTYCTNVFDRQLQQGRRTCRRNAQRRQRKIQKLQDKLEQSKRLCNRYKKRLSRLRGRVANSEMPGTKTKVILQASTVHSPVKKALKFHFALVGDLNEKYKAANKTKSKQDFANILTGKLIRKYKCQLLCQRNIGFLYKAWRKPMISSRETTTNKRKTVRHYYLSDDVSRLTTGKKKTQSLSRR